MKSKLKKFLVPLLVISIGVNAYLLWDRYWESQYTPDAKDQVILGEMISKVIKSEDYQTINDNLSVIAIYPTVDKAKGGKFPYYYEVSVKTERQTYLFSCDNETCSAVENSGKTYSIYQDEDPVLPLKKTRALSQEDADKQSNNN